MPITKQCQQCSKDFNVPPSRSATALTCSRECKSLFVRLRTRGGYAERQCPECGEAFSCPQHEAHRRTFCSEPCSWASQSRGWMQKEKSEGGNVSRKKDGYIAEYRPRHPFASRGWVLQHRLVMEVWMREQGAAPHLMVEVDGELFLRRDIEVHHRNEFKDMNDRDNLVACTRLAHRAMHHGKPVQPDQAWPLNGLIVKGVALCRTIGI